MKYWSKKKKEWTKYFHSAVMQRRSNPSSLSPIRWVFTKIYSFEQRKDRSPSGWHACRSPKSTGASTSGWLSPDGTVSRIQTTRIEETDIEYTWGSSTTANIMCWTRCPTCTSVIGQRRGSYGSLRLGSSSLVPSIARICCTAGFLTRVRNQSSYPAVELHG